MKNLILIYQAILWFLIVVGIGSYNVSLWAMEKPKPKIAMANSVAGFCLVIDQQGRLTKEIGALTKGHHKEGERVAFVIKRGTYCEGTVVSDKAHSKKHGAALANFAEELAEYTDRVLRIRLDAGNWFWAPTIVALRPSHWNSIEELSRKQFGNVIDEEADLVRSSYQKNYLATWYTQQHSEYSLTRLGQGLVAVVPLTIIAGIAYFFKHSFVIHNSFC